MLVCRFNDPSPVKKQKLSILTLLANDKNMSEIITELSEYVSDVDVDIARSAIKVRGTVLPDCLLNKPHSLAC